MPSLKTILSASAIAFFATADAHMVLMSPPPYGTPDNSPLDPQGANFPCKATSNTGGNVTEMVVGAQQVMSFKGSAVHGGGSCQISLTKDNPATKNSKWMVIHSIMSGCPARNAGGNLTPNPDGTSADTYKYTIPQGIEAGTYTLAWTWFNRIGNREMYMNCANIKVIAGSSKRDIAVNETEAYMPILSERAATPTFPDMFLANIPTSDCVTPEDEDTKFPNPGSSVETAATTPKLTPPTGPKCGAAGTSASTDSSSGSSGSSSSSGAAPAADGAASGASGASSSSSGSSGAAPAAPAAASGASGASSGSASPATAAAAPDSQTAPAAAGGSSAAAGGASAAPAASAAAAPSVAAPIVAAPAASSAPSVVANSSGSSSSTGSTAPAAPATGSSTGTCSTAGQSICSPDGRQIGTCNVGLTVQWIPVAAGTKCSGGYMVAAKRSAKFNSGYVRRNLALGP